MSELHLIVPLQLLPSLIGSLLVSLTFMSHLQRVHSSLNCPLQYSLHSQSSLTSLYTVSPPLPPPPRPPLSILVFSSLPSVHVSFVQLSLLFLSLDLPAFPVLRIFMFTYSSTTSDCLNYLFHFTSCHRCANA